MVILRSKKWILLASVVALGAAANLHASDNPVNDMLVRTELYVWNRFADFLEIGRGGIGVGPAIGAEIAITEYAQLGAYYAKERGVSFPHFLPPLWLVPYVEGDKIFREHAGVYHTTSFGTMRRENTLIEERRFRRGKYDVRLQVAPGIFHLYGNWDMNETVDFLAGVALLDPNEDDEQLDPNAQRFPADQLGRGVTNVIGGVVEIPQNMMQVTTERGDFAGATTGLAQGIWRCLMREGVGVMEVITFPMGWPPIIEPGYPYEPGRSSDWDLNTPQFMKRF